MANGKYVRAGSPHVRGWEEFLFFLAERIDRGGDMNVLDRIVGRWRAEPVWSELKRAHCSQ